MYGAVLCFVRLVVHFVLGALTFGLKCLFFFSSRIIGHPQLRKWALKTERGGGGGGTIFPQKKRGQNERGWWWVAEHAKRERGAK